MVKLTTVRAMLATACLLLASLSAAAQTYPAKSVRVVAGYAAGGAADLHARALAEGLTKVLGQSFYVENRLGAAGAIAAEYVARAAPDGYTLMVATSGALAIPQHFGKLPYDAVKDFIPVSQVTTNDIVLLVNKNFPAKTFPEFVQLLKKEPNKYSYGVSGKGAITHITGERLKDRMGIDMQVIPYKGDSQALADTIGGASPISLVALSSVGAVVKSGNVRALVVMGPERLKQFPDIPTLVELGYPDFISSSWIGLFAPAGTPPEIVRILAEASRKAMSDPAMVERLESTGARVAIKGPQEFATFMAKEIADFGQIIKVSNIKAD
jgi:tripartite-type tricarboxylate transporter receptor subunit TctC